MSVLDRELAVDRLKRIQTIGDETLAHALAERTICELLSGLGYVDVVAEYWKVRRPGVWRLKGKPVI